MIIHKGFKYRLDPTPQQKQLLLQHGGNTRFLWNSLLSNNIEYYKEEGKFNFGHVMITSLPSLKEEHDFLKLSFSQSLQTVGRQLNDTLTIFLKERKTNKNIGFPKFKKKSIEHDSFHCPQRWKTEKRYVKIPKIGKVKWIKHRSLRGRPKSITITQDGDQWYCSVLCEITIKEKPKKDKNIVGIDVGLKDFAVLSDGEVIRRQRFTKDNEKRLATEQRRLSRKEKGSQNRAKQRKVVQKVHRKIRNSRKDFLHKTTHRMTAKYDGFCLEDLNIKGMMKNGKLSKSIGDASWSEFKRQLEYKSLWNWKHFIQIGRWFPSTKTCSSCGGEQSMNLKDRIYECKSCGFVMNRDLNAAVNILNEGLNTLGHRGINACGDGKVHAILDSKNPKRQVAVDEAETKNMRITV